MRKSILVFMLLCFSIVSLAQSIRVTGRITGAAGQPVQNASVVVRGTNNGVTTDRNGEFAINAARGQTLVISSVGFSAQELVVERETVNISLSANVTELTDVVVVGYGTQRRGSITGSVTTVSGEELTRRQVASTSNLLQGLAPGLVVQQTSGRPGADQATLRIRGIGSFSAVQSPLILSLIHI